MKKTILASIALLGLTSCATILEGKNQTISIQSNPSCAKCGVFRQGQPIASVECTPSGVMIEKTKHDLTVTCTKQGYAPSSQILESGIEGAVAGNILVGGLIGWGIDSATGADNKYPNNVIVNMVPTDGKNYKQPYIPSPAEIKQPEELQKPSNIQSGIQR